MGAKDSLKNDKKSNASTDKAKKSEIQSKKGKNFSKNETKMKSA